MRVLISCFLFSCAAADLSVLPDYVRADPFGRIVPADRGAAEPARTLTLETARAAYVSCRILVSLPQPGPYTLNVSAPFETELYREWFHLLPAKKLYYPDALIPARAPYSAQMPDAGNRIPGQTTQSFWLDAWIPANAAAGVHTVRVSAGGATLDIQVRVLDAQVPPADPVLIDHNSYGTSWMSAQYPTVGRNEDGIVSLIHAYHRIFDEHRGIFHQLGYGHGGKVGPEFAPRLEGSGRTRRVADWTLYDKHYGPLLDGSAFANTRRGARPIPFVYLPVNPEWPASFANWGEPGYEREFVNVVSEMEAHFRSKGWTQTRFELFFNHKKRYKAFPWDGDETRFLHDFPFVREYGRLLRLAVKPDSPVRFVHRSDVSWQMERQFKDLAGIINFWVCGGGMFGWYADQLPELKRRGDIVWTYGGTPPVDEPASHITTEVLRTWLLGVDGFVRWQTVIPGADPWFAFDGGGETLVYPGERFGIGAPLASVRLKLQRNALQDLALLDALKAPRAEAARRFNTTLLADWRAPRPKLADSSPDEWTNADIDDALPKDARFGERLDAAAWSRVRAYALSLVREARR